MSTFKAELSAPGPDLVDRVNAGGPITASEGAKMEIAAIYALARHGQVHPMDMMAALIKAMAWVLAAVEDPNRTYLSEERLEAERPMRSPADLQQEMTGSVLADPV